MGKVLENVQERDASAHRMVFGMDPIDDNVWNGGVGGSDRARSYAAPADAIISDAERRAEKLKRQLVLQSRSLDTITAMAKDRETMLASIPSIKPVRSDKLARSIRMLSGFGMRVHPIYKRRKMHTGLDFTAPERHPRPGYGRRGGRIRQARTSRATAPTWSSTTASGTRTLYGHLSKMIVKQGQTRQTRRGTRARRQYGYEYRATPPLRGPQPRR